MHDSFGDRMKAYEKREERTLLPLLPALARIDGRCFSSFTRGMGRPYDLHLSNLMVTVTGWLVRETNACMGYTQSDEISLCWLQEDYKSELFFGGRVQKMASTLAALTSVYFLSALPDYFPARRSELVSRLPTFDARVWNVPNLIEGTNVFLWREQDATRNSIQMVAQSVYSHTELQGKDSKELHELLFQRGINWNDYPTFFKRGTYIQRKRVIRKFTTEERELLPAKHEARTDPDLLVERWEYRTLSMPPLAKVTNRIGVIFYGDDPLTEQPETA